MADTPETPPGDSDRDIDEWLAYAGDDVPQPRWPPDRHHVGLLRAAPIAIAVLTVAGLVLLRPTGSSRETAAAGLGELGIPTQFHAAEVTSVVSMPCEFDETSVCDDVDYTLTAGPDSGSVFEQSFVEGSLTPHFDVGDHVVLSYRVPNGIVLGSVDGPCSFDVAVTCWTISVSIEDVAPAIFEVTEDDPVSFLLSGDAIDVSYTMEDGKPVVNSAVPPDVATQYQFADFQRRPVLLWVVVVFVVAVVALGRWKGVAALGGLAASIGVLLLFVLPAILDGRSPVLVAVVGSAAIAMIALYGAHGFGARTTVALLGMIGALGLTAALSWIVVVVSHFSGFASEEATLLSVFEGVDVPGLVLAGIVLGAAGALDDVTVTQAAAVWQLRSANPSLTMTDLWRRGLQIGRDHIAATVNTLLLAYSGAALPLLILFVLARQSLGAVANSEVVAVEVVRTLVGSIGLVAAVPLTTWLAALIASGSPPSDHGH
jgi:uncharacterized membrane protein